MDSLVAIGSACSFAYSVVMTFLISDDPHAYVHNLYYESAAVVLTLVSLGEVPGEPEHAEDQGRHHGTDAPVPRHCDSCGLWKRGSHQISEKR